MVAASAITGTYGVGSKLIPTSTLRGRGGGANNNGRQQNSSTTTIVSHTTNEGQQQRRNLATLELVGNNGSPSGAFPLQECQADCDNDSECDYGLVCIQRGNEFVPGCDDGTPIDGEDYCIKAQPLELHRMGNNGSPSANFPLQNCQGDCDNDNECAPGLKCYQRSGVEPVPGCAGAGYSGNDYCYDPNGVTVGPPGTNVETAGNNNIPPEAFPLQSCQADCDSDYDVSVLYNRIINLSMPCLLPALCM